MTTFDSPWKETLEVYFRLFLELLLPTIHQDLDWLRGYEFLDKELQQIMPEAAQGKGEVDKLVKVWLKDGRENWLLLHLEVQAQEESDFPLRMFVYNYRIFDRYNREVVSVAILGDDRPGWRPNLYRTERWGCRKEFTFPVVKLLDWRERIAELEASRNPVAKVILAHLRALETRGQAEVRRQYKYQLVRNLFEGGMQAEDIRQLFRLIDWLMTLPADLERQFREDVYKIKEEKHMPYVTSFERLAREEGLEEGQRNGLLRGIKALLAVRFGESEKDLMMEIAKIQNVSHLEKILSALEQNSSLEEIRKLIADVSSSSS